MAPTVPKPRRTAPTSNTTKSRPSKSSHSSTSNSNPMSTSSSSTLFPTTKADKRRMKHSALLTRIEKSHSKPKSKPRRPSKKLITTLESLADALPEADALEGKDVEVGNVRIKQRSLKSRPGTMRKRARMEGVERERFQRNLVEMTRSGEGRVDGSGKVGGQAKEGEGGTGGPGTTARWAALRGFISATMETKEG